MRFQLFQQGERRLWFWRLLDPTGSVVATSNIGKDRPEDCTKEIRTLNVAFRYGAVTRLTDVEPT